MVKIVKFYVLYSHSETKTKKTPHIRIFNSYHKVVKGFTDGFRLCLVTQSCMTLCDPINRSPPVSSLHGNSPGKNTRVGCHALLEEIFPTQGLNPGLLHCSWILYCLSHQGSPKTLEWVAYPFSRGSSQPRDQTQVSCIAGRFFTS